jgi:cysteine-rich repeat protein
MIRTLDGRRNTCVECLTAADCAEEQFCQDNICSPDECTAGEKVCEGSIVKECKPDGSGWFEQEECNQEQYCQDGDCHPLVCTPNTVFCDGNMIVQCNESGTGYFEVQNCEDTKQVCIDGECTGNLCGSIQFGNEENYITIPHHPDLSLADTSFTIEAWVKFTIGESQEAGSPLIFHEDSEGFSFLLYYYSVGWSAGFGFFNPEYVELSMAAPKDIQQWSHLSVTYDFFTEFTTIWWNGQAESIVLGASLASSVGDLIIGGKSEYVFQLDEIRLSNIVRYKSAFNPSASFTPDEHTVALWKLNESDGELVLDISDNAHSGILTGGQRTSDSPACSEGKKCGDGIVAPWEVCDDGNTLYGDTCSGNCTWDDCSGYESFGKGIYCDYSCHSCEEVELNIVGDLTIEMRFKPQSMEGIQTLISTSRLFVQYPDEIVTNETYQVSFFQNGAIEFFHEFGDHVKVLAVTEGENLIVPNEWNILTVVRDSVALEWKVYHDGIWVESVPYLANPVVDKFGSLNIGRDLFSGQDNGLNGKIDYLRIWNRKLEPFEITAMSGKSINPHGNEGLVGYWEFNDFYWSSFGGNGFGYIFDLVGKTCACEGFLDSLWYEGECN